jgi:hypothetical protein
VTYGKKYLAKLARQGKLLPRDEATIGIVLVSAAGPEITLTRELLLKARAAEWSSKELLAYAIEAG